MEAFPERMEAFPRGMEALPERMEALPRQGYGSLPAARGGTLAVAMERRNVDWSQLLASDEPAPQVLRGTSSSELISLLSALDELIACGHTDAILERAVEIARERVGLIRAAIFLRDEPNRLMRGTWGTDLAGATVDEHFIAYDLPAGDREYYDRAAREGVYWSVIENAPLVEHSPDETRIFRRGWVCCTPIRSGTTLFGLMFNDAGSSETGIDDLKQARCAVLCSLLGTALEVAQRRGDTEHAETLQPRSALVAKTARMLAEEPNLTSAQLGERLGLSASRVARLFKTEMGMSLVEYKNRLRLERFFTLVDESADNLLDAALSAGFGSYAQFHRVFVAHRGTTPSKFVRARANRRK